ncbi:MAG: hypothetical protein HZA54_06945, partial [Planctomycetes bacterium]|nr:hypothetical protein [Planctomycetota bacterium]
AAALAALGGGVRDYMEILYALDPDPEGDRWYRAYLPGPVVGPEPFDEELLASPAFFGAAGELVARGVVWVGYAFWAPGTTTWDLGVPPRASGVRGTGDAGPDPRWDSTRALDRDFALFLKTIPRVPPLADVLPVSVRVTVTVEADPGRARPVTLGAALTAADNERALVSSSAELPDAPAALLVEREWIAYTEKGDGWIKIGTRGARGTAPAAHESGARVRFGTTFERTVAIPAGSGGVVER